jgi:O-antigen chain-terminating methyltransferase
MDPTHEKPIPHLLLSFLTEFTGFDRTKLLRLQEQCELHDQSQTIDLITALGSASPDYAIVAQKNAPESVAALFDEPFARIFGITPGELAARYDQRIDTRFENLEVKMDGVSALTEKFLQSLAELNSELSAVRDQNGSLEHRNGTLEQQNGALLVRNESLEAAMHALQARLSQAESNHSAADSALNAVVHSASWKITYPLRKVSSLVRGGKSSSQTGSFKRSLALRAINFVAARPRLKRVAVIAANRLPRSLKAKLSAIAIISGAPVSASNGPVSGTPLLSMREADIYLELKHALERKESK